jgi:hypothetical protein
MADETIDFESFLEQIVQINFPSSPFVTLEMAAGEPTNNVTLAVQWSNSPLKNGFGFPGTLLNTPAGSSPADLLDFVLVQKGTVTDWGGRPPQGGYPVIGISSASVFSQYLEDIPDNMPPVNIASAGAAWQQPFPSILSNNGANASIGFLNLGILAPNDGFLLGTLQFSSAADQPVGPYNCVVKLWDSINRIQGNTAAPPSYFRSMLIPLDPQDATPLATMSLSNPGTIKTTITYSFVFTSSSISIKLISS